MKFLPIHEAGGRSRWTWGCKTTLGPKNCQKRPVFLAEDSLDTFNNQLKWKIQLKIRSKQFKTVHKLQLQFNQFISSVRFVSLLLFIVSSETIIERGALQYVIKPFLYCDLFKASARAKKKEKKNIFVACHVKIPAFVLTDEFSNDLIKKREEKLNVLLSK